MIGRPFIAFLIGFVLMWGLLWGCSRAHSMSLQQANVIYLKLLKANHIHLAPKLTIWHNDYPDDPNAVSSPLKLKVTPGLLKVATKDEMAMVLGHELTHILNGDSFRPLKYNWEYEYIADLGGANIARKAGYNVCEGKQVLWKFGKGGGDHPYTKERHRRIKC